MRLSPRCTAAWGCLLFLAVTLLPSPPAHAQSAAEVQAALSRMHRWVGTNDNGRRWRSYLKSDQLSAQIENGESADLGQLKEVLAAYESGAAGLESTQFAAVHDSLSQWIDVLYVPPVDELGSLALAAKESFVPVGDDQVARARTELRSALASLDSLLSRGSAANKQAWQRYLQSQTLQEQLAAETPDLATLESVWFKYRANEAGLELPEFARVRDALRRVIDTTYYASNDQLESQYGILLDQLAKSLDQLNESPNDQLTSEIGLTIGRLEGAGQAPGLVRAVRRNFSEPNLYFTVQDDVLRRGIVEDVDDVSSINENILGVSVQGTAHTQGRTDVRMVADGNQAVFDILLSGTAHSDNVGYKRSVAIYSRGETQLAAYRRIVLDEAGLHGLPATAECSTETDIYCITANRQLVERMAWRQAMKKQGQAEAIASSRAERRVAGKIEEESQELIANANHDFINRFRAPLVRRGEFPERMEFSTTPEALTLVMLQSNGQQLSVGGAPPEMSGSYHMQAQVHETFAGNFAEAIIGGEVLTDAKLVDILVEAGREVPEELQLSPDKDSWSITFMNLRPVSVTFDGQTARVAIRGRQFTKADQELNDPMEIAATYNMEMSEGGMLLTRQGDLEITFIGRENEQLGARQVAFKTFMRRKWDSVFKEEIQTPGIELPERWEGARLVLEHLDSDGGWLSLGWNMGEAPTETDEQVAVHE